MKWINDRFTFDNLFRKLLQKNYSHYEAKVFILNNYSLSALVFQERIENNFYKKIVIDNESEDLIVLRNKIYRNISYLIKTRNEKCLNPL
ncbi:MAG: hypothetical protein PWQ09_618 [Candidatus Cloacimonadota bacterium]|jgi:hypothetical protein|nr:hypothetical protein [Candidatus Cloacimonadota bacterium]